MKKPILSVLCTIMMGFSFFSIRAGNTTELPEVQTEQVFLIDTLSGDTILLSYSTGEFNQADSLLNKPLIKNENRRKKLVSGLLALPFPFGFIGAHRVMLGTKPWIPVVYIATFGGCFGLLPLIDFCVIMFSKDIEQYENNPHIFMWVK